MVQAAPSARCADTTGVLAGVLLVELELSALGNTWPPIAGVLLVEI
jgi:hypothetical protein